MAKATTTDVEVGDAPVQDDLDEVLDDEGGDMDVEVDDVDEGAADADGEVVEDEEPEPEPSPKATPGDLIDELLGALRAKQAETPAVVKTPTAAAHVPTPPPAVTEEQIEQIATEMGADTPTIKAALKLLQPLIQQTVEYRTGQMVTGMREVAVERYLRTVGVEDVTPADVIGLMDEDGVTDAYWGQGTAEQQRAYLQRRVREARGMKLEAAPTTVAAAAKIPAKTPPRTSAPRAAGSRTRERDWTKEEGFADAVREYRKFGLSEDDAKAGVVKYLQKRAAQETRGGR